MLARAVTILFTCADLSEYWMCTGIAVRAVYGDSLLCADTVRWRAMNTSTTGGGIYEDVPLSASTGGVYCASARPGQRHTAVHMRGEDREARHRLAPLILSQRRQRRLSISCGMSATTGRAGARWSRRTPAASHRKRRPPGHARKRRAIWRGAECYADAATAPVVVGCGRRDQ